MSKQDKPEAETDVGGLIGCEPCYFWRKNGCVKAKSGFPTVGDFCYSYEREPGVEG